MRFLEKEVSISEDKIQGDSFVRYGNQVGLGNSYRESHEGIALKHKLFYPESNEEGSKIQLDDTGLISDYGDKLVIPSYISTTTQLAQLIGKSGDNHKNALEEIRVETGQIIASITQKPVEIQLKDKTTITISPKQIDKAD